MLASDKIRAEIEPHLIQLRQEGWCVLEGVIPESEIDSVREYVSASSEKALEAYTNDTISVIANLPAFAPYLADERVLGIAKTMFNHPHVRIAQTELKTIAPHNGDALTPHLPFRLASRYPRFIEIRAYPPTLPRHYNGGYHAVDALAVYGGERRHVDCAAKPSGYAESAGERRHRSEQTDSKRNASDGVRRQCVGNG